MKQLLSNAPFDLLFAYLLWLGLYQQVEWAANISMFLVYVFTLFGLLMVSDKLRDTFRQHYMASHKHPRSPVFRRWDMLTDFVFVLIVVGAGHLFLGTLLFIATSLKQSLSHDIDKELKHGIRSEGEGKENRTGQETSEQHVVQGGHEGRKEQAPSSGQAQEVH